jgi:adenylylsulfate kinase
MKRILIMGISGAGKTTLAKSLQARLDSVHFNADLVRGMFDDWDFSAEGRIRQSQRMRDLADATRADYVIADFIAPLNRMRDIFDADFTIWMDTVQRSEFPDTDTMFVPPTSSEYDLRITDFNYNIDDIIKELP